MEKETIEWLTIALLLVQSITYTCLIKALLHISCVQTRIMGMDKCLETILVKKVCVVFKNNIFKDNFIGLLLNPNKTKIQTRIRYRKIIF